VDGATAELLLKKDLIIGIYDNLIDCILLSMVILTPQFSSDPSD